MPRFTLLRYRRPSVKVALGITKAKRQLKKATGYYAVTKPRRWGTNTKRTVLRNLGSYSGPMKFLRFLTHQMYPLLVLQRHDPIVVHYNALSPSPSGHYILPCRR